MKPPIPSANIQLSEHGKQQDSKIPQGDSPQKLAEEMEMESRSWMLRCAECKHERSFWEMGGIRWKAAGNPGKHGRCPDCGKTGWLTVHRKPDK
jgi:uncharacterized protein with PIN domain